MSAYERPNLTFVKGGFGSIDLPPADVVRSFNVLIYYDADFRRNAENWAAQVLRPGGLFICGRDDSETFNAHYSVYRNEGGRLVEKEFAFGLETIRHGVWFTIHEGERETWRLAELLGILRSDREFLRDTTPALTLSWRKTEWPFATKTAISPSPRHRPNPAPSPPTTKSAKRWKQIRRPRHIRLQTSRPPSMAKSRRPPRRWLLCFEKLEPT